MACGKHHMILAVQSTLSFLTWVCGESEREQDIPVIEDRIRYGLRFERIIRSKIELERAELDDFLESDESGSSH